MTSRVSQGLAAECVRAQDEESGPRLWTWARPDRRHSDPQFPLPQGGRGGRAGPRELSSFFRPGCSVRVPLPWPLRTARHKAPSSGNTCSLSQVAPMKDPRGAKLTPRDSNSRGEGRGGWEG